MSSTDLSLLIAAAYDIAMGSAPSSIPVNQYTPRVNEILAAMIVTYNTNKGLIN